jgi:hypothetical protein
MKYWCFRGYYTYRSVATSKFAWKDSDNVYVVQNSQNFSGLFPSSCIRLALSKRPNWVGVFSPTYTWGRKQIQFPKRRVFWNTGRWKSPEKFCEFCTPPNYIICIIHPMYSSSFCLFLFIFSQINFIWTFVTKLRWLSEYGLRTGRPGLHSR